MVVNVTAMPLPKPPTLGETIRAWRKHRGLTQAQLAEPLGVTQAMIAYWENDARRITAVQLVRLANALQVPPEPSSQPSSRPTTIPTAKPSHDPPPPHTPTPSAAHPARAAAVTATDTPATLSVDEAARLLGIGRSAMYAAVNRGNIVAIQIGQRIRIPTHVITNLLEYGNNRAGATTGDAES